MLNFFRFEFRIHYHGISVLFCSQISVRDVHTWGLLHGRRPLSSCYLELVICGSMAQLPWLFSTFQIYSAFAICYQFYGLIVIYAGSSRLYLVSRKSANQFVFVGFFLCVVLFASRNVLLLRMTFGLLLLLSVRSIWVYCIGRTGLDWTGLVKRGLRIGSCGRLFFLDFFYVCKSDKTER